jgi:DNA-binding response OmpR family regulator
MVSKNRNKILFVDDDDELREIVRDQLTAAGYELDEAVDGEAAIEKLGSVEYDLVLLDITMPGATGMDVLKFIKERSLTCRVIMLTGMVGLSVAIDSMKMGADDYITKPYHMEYLLASIKRSLERAQ